LHRLAARSHCQAVPQKNPELHIKGMNRLAVLQARQVSKNFPKTKCSPEKCDKRQPYITFHPGLCN